MKEYFEREKERIGVKNDQSQQQSVHQSEIIQNPKYAANPNFNVSVSTKKEQPENR